MTNINIEEIQEYLKNKSIAIVGSGSCIEDKEWGKDIDSHDIVIRINNAFRNSTWQSEKYQKYVGTRTDIYIANGDTNNKRKWAVTANKIGVKYTLRLNPGAHGSSNPSPLQHQLLKEVKNVYMAWEFKPTLSKFESEFGGRPASGAILIKWLTTYIKYKSISLYGFDFFNEFNSLPPKWGEPAGGKIKFGKQNKYWNKFQCSWRGVHNSKAEKKFFEKNINKYNIKHNI